MAEFVIDSDDGTTEAAFLEYKGAQFAVRQRVAGLYDAAQGTLGMYAAFEERMGDEGDLVGMAEYHDAKKAGLAEAEAALLGMVEGLVGLIGQMQAGYADGDLFPGVPKSAPG